MRRAREDALKLYGVFLALAEAARRIGEAHARRKEERGGLSYADLERCALRALTREEVRNSVRGQYDYVFVDEYQDVSDLQEALIAAVSRGDDLSPSATSSSPSTASASPNRASSSAATSATCAARAGSFCP